MTLSLVSTSAEVWSGHKFAYAVLEGKRERACSWQGMPWEYCQTEKYTREESNKDCSHLKVSQRCWHSEHRTKQYLNIQSRQLSRRALTPHAMNKIKFEPRVLALAPRRSITCFLSHNIGNYARVS